MAAAKPTLTAALRSRVDKIEQALIQGLGLDLTGFDQVAILAAEAKPTTSAKQLSYDERLHRLEVVLRSYGFYL